jgi:hypothetical protein
MPAGLGRGDDLQRGLLLGMVLGQELRRSHEHRASQACTRCSLLRVDPAQKQRLEDIRGNLTARITEAEREGWAGEAEGLKVSLAAANNKLAQIELSLARRAEAVSLGMPSYRDAAAATLSPGDLRDR